LQPFELCRTKTWSGTTLPSAGKCRYALPKRASEPFRVSCTASGDGACSPSVAKIPPPRTARPICPLSYIMGAGVGHSNVNWSGPIY
jgi:hypothetical protein